MGVGTLSVWMVVIFMFFIYQNNPISAGKHVVTYNSVMEKDEITFTGQQKVYAIKTREKPTSMKLDSIMVTNDNNKVSIDVLLEMLDVKKE